MININYAIHNMIELGLEKISRRIKFYPRGVLSSGWFYPRGIFPDTGRINVLIKPDLIISLWTCFINTAETVHYLAGKWKYRRVFLLLRITLTEGSQKIFKLFDKKVWVQVNFFSSTFIFEYLWVLVIMYNVH